MGLKQFHTQQLTTMLVEAHDKWQNNDAPNGEFWHGVYEGLHQANVMLGFTPNDPPPASRRAPRAYTSNRPTVVEAEPLRPTLAGLLQAMKEDGEP